LVFILEKDQARRQKQQKKFFISTAGLSEAIIDKIAD